MKAARLILADDHQVVRQGLRGLLEQDGDLRVVAEAADGAAAERLALEIAADLLVLDIALPVKSGTQVLESLRTQGSRLPVLLFSMHPAVQYVNFARRHGAQGFVSKDADTRQLLQAVRRILAGGTSFPKQGGGPRRPDDPLAVLSPRESEVFKGLLQGEPLADIATRLGIGAKSISTYRRRMLDKLGVETNAELIALALRRD